MTNRLSPEKRSHIMSMIRSKDTKPEILVRRYLFHAGFRFRVNVRKLPGTPDIVLRKYKTAIFINGCFWHGHEGCPEFRPPRTRTEWWEQKLRRNKERDERVRAQLTEMGWHTMVVWECQLKPDRRQATLEEIVRLLEKSYVESAYHVVFQSEPKAYSHDPEPASFAAEDGNLPQE